MASGVVQSADGMTPLLLAEHNAEPRFRLCAAPEPVASSRLWSCSIGPPRVPISLLFSPQAAESGRRADASRHCGVPWPPGVAARSRASAGSPALAVAAA